MEEKEIEELGDFIKHIKSKARCKKKNPNLPARLWKEDETIDGKPAKALVIVLTTRGCRWNLCSMCGYFRESLDAVSPTNILKQIEFAISKYQGEEMIKIFTSGSFLDEEEIDFATQGKIMKQLSKLKEVKIISIESRPEFVDPEKLEELIKIVHPKKLEVSLGLESANDRILKYSINKGFRFSDYVKSAKVAKEAKASVKTYILLKPPFLTEREAINDCIESIRKVADITDTISLNPVSIHRYTLVEYLWERGDYRPPWLWSVIEVLKEGKKILEEKRIKCDITGGGEKRGAHNCGRCDKKILDAIKRFSLDQDLNHIEDIYCDCAEEWKDALDLEIFSMGTMVRLYESCGG
ncbi:MAG: TIGR01210 family radical SAM protein [Thermoplasmata archaeon]|nr:MAG: TIGR01210 family radical SAM protein [Thermoplasmata archaeon]